MIAELLYMALCLWASTVIHEMGHYLAARWVAIPVTRFQVGSGPTVLRCSLQGVRFRFRLLPFGGHVAIGLFSTRPSAKNRWRYHTLFVAGPLANFAVACVVYIAGISDFLAILNLALAVGNILPFIPGNDGHSIWYLYRHQKFSETSTLAATKPR